MGTGNEEWRKKADIHKMSAEEVKAAGVEGSKRPPQGQHPGEILHQRRALPYSRTTMAICGFVISGSQGPKPQLAMSPKSPATLCALKITILASNHTLFQFFVKNLVFALSTLNKFK
ncbi:hypothetical protein RJ641_022091 [Dillenia turbinata]|uniref:Uncharacterized protein n=1 Tax=Dillenia turbinata TaxID=194707 RepID=A0AAN8UBN7_9MAGN